MSTRNIVGIAILVFVGSIIAVSLAYPGPHDGDTSARAVGTLLLSLVPAGLFCAVALLFFRKKEESSTIQSIEGEGCRLIRGGSLDHNAQFVIDKGFLTMFTGDGEIVPAGCKVSKTYDNTRGAEVLKHIIDRAEFNHTSSDLSDEESE